MTQIDFYTRAEDKLLTVCRLVAKALQHDLRVLVYTPDTSVTDALDRLLWSVPSTGFIPHCRAGHALAALTPVIVDHVCEPLHHDEVLVNLHAEWPPFFSRFQRLIEVVGRDQADAHAGRERFRFYRQRGYEVRHHDLAARQGKP